MLAPFYRWTLALAAAAAGAATLVHAGQAAPARLRIEVTAAPGLVADPLDGRLFVVLAGAETPEPRTLIGRTGMDAAPVLEVDVPRFDGRAPAIVDRRAIAFPVSSLGTVPPGDYVAQAVFDTNVDVKSLNAPGNLYSVPTRVRIDPASSSPVRLTLSGRVADEALPPAAGPVRFVKIPSTLLSAFHGRPIYLSLRRLKGTAIVEATMLT